LKACLLCSLTAHATLRVAVTVSPAPREEAPIGAPPRTPEVSWWARACIRAAQARSRWRCDDNEGVLRVPRPRAERRVPTPTLFIGLALVENRIVCKKQFFACCPFRVHHWEPTGQRSDLAGRRPDTRNPTQVTPKALPQSPKPITLLALRPEPGTKTLDPS
jgi:hypothetical protein